MRFCRPFLFFWLILVACSLRSAAQDPNISHIRNYQNCLYGRYGCDQSQLTPEEHQAVSRSAHDRNYQNCLYGRYACDQAQLTAVEQPVVAQAAHDRNYQNCLYGRYACDQAQLTAVEQPVVAQAAHDRNYQNCLYGRYACDQAQLTTVEQQSVASSPTTLAHSGAAPATASTEASGATAPACAENGSCYGDISERTGRPKTVHVEGYYRKDGTYVRGHYRSAPRHR
jgi:hypothetical protein